ncbi:hypothetical protein B0A49_12067 [Cryomyces minteri]|uniref:C2 domain-containing protein n=1 Tax=Cryomyces minteri TaxID=331657 RepID=A0A4U0WE89_9PEZI|nr:hypothetical protein B0A49_12067 [Cryomyces minteri]
MLLFVLEKILGFGRTLSAIVVLVVGLGLGLVVIRGLQGWVANKVKEVWEDEVWDAERQKGDETANSPTPESTQWLNSVLASIWPLVNPDLFTSLADTLEDVMQASLPKLVRMVSIEDIGQGSESLRILGIRWLPTGAAAQSVSVDGKIQSDSDDKKKSDRSVAGEGEVKGNTDEDAAEGQQQSAPNNAQDEQEGEAIAEGLEAEDGDFMNLEVAFAYRARSSTRKFKDRAKNAHLYLAFYLPGSVKLPVWVELRGLVGTVRLRLQLTPDPPFFALCTLTFLGQPKVDLSCVPLVKKGLNIMNLPLISNFVQSAVDAAMAEYVAPKSLTLGLKNMLVGDDFKKDTDARGVLIIRIKRAYDFKEGDSGLPLVKRGSADPYVTLSWAKFGKPLWSTRVILSEMEPCWDETAFVLVTPEALNVDERLRVQLWDSDRTTADDDLGRVELGLKDLMRDPHSNGKMWDRTDGLKALKAGEGMPGKIEWSVGYFSKSKILDSQLAQQTDDPSVQNTEQLRRKVHEESEKKLREANKDQSDELEQQKAQDFKARQDQFAISSPPPEGYPSGIFSIQIHQITGLEIGKNNKDRDDKADGASDEEETGESLPSAYCTIILNQQKIFKTRTKPKNSKPFFNAGTERFVRDWRQTEVMISVRDARVHEDDALLGVIYLPLGKIFAERSQINGNYPLAGGIGYGRCRVSVVFRSVQLQAPKELLGWDWGTLEISPQAHSSDLAHDLRGLRIKLRTSLQRGKMHYVKEGNDAKWASRHDRPIHLAVRKRYCSSLVVEFRSHSALLDKTPAFAVLWLKDIPDNEEKTVTLTVWKGDLKRAETRCVQECGQKAGTIELRVTFWSGLSGYHSKLASKDRNLADVMEVLDTANDSEMKEEADDRSGSSSDSSDSSDDDDGNDGKRLFKKSASNGSSNGGGKTADSTDDELATSGKRGPIETFKDFRKHNKQLNRRHRGLMQWKGARTVQWAKHKLEHGEQHVSNLFRHGERDTGVETEV